MEIIGRSTELEAIPGFLDRTAPARGLLLRGEAGISKTVLWQHLVASARADGYTVLASQPTESETRLSYAALGDLVSALPAAALEALPEPQRTALDVALLRAGGARTEELAVSMAFVSLLAWSAASAPVLVAVDDAQWIDAPTSRVLEFAFRRAADRDIRLVLAVRSAESAPQSPPRSRTGCCVHSQARRPGSWNSGSSAWARSIACSPRGWNSTSRDPHW